MKATLTAGKFLLLLILLFTSFNLQAQDSRQTGQVKRGVTVPLQRSYHSVFKATIPTHANSTSRVTGLTDGQDVRIFPSNSIQSEVHISINKNSPNNLIASCNTYNGGFNQGYYYTSDGGITWNGADQLQNSPPAGLAGDPTTAYGANGKAYITSSNIGGGGYYCQTSTNNGATWGPLIVGGSTLTFDKPMTAVDDQSSSPYANNFYCAWTSFGYNSVQINKSTDGGNTFTSPITLKNGFGQGTNIQTGPNGEVYVCWADYDGTEVPSHGLGFCKSLDGGNTYSGYQRVINYTGIRVNGVDVNFGNTRVADFPSMAVDKSNGVHRGRIYVTISDKENGSGKAIAQVSYSDDQGNTWSNPITVSIPNGRQNWFPWITTDDCNGDVFVAYYSLDTQTGTETNTYVAHSSDGGVSWDNLKVSDVSHTTAPINNSIFSPGYAGDYIGIAAYGGKVYPIWADNRNGNWQIYCSPITLTPIITGPSTALCIGSSATYSLSFLPCNSTVTWSTNAPQVSIQPNGQTAVITNNGYNGTITLTALITYSNGTTGTVTLTIFAGPPGFGAYYNNGLGDQPVRWYDPNNPTTSLNNVCIGYTNNYVVAQPYGTDNVIWSTPSGFPTNNGFSWQPYGPNKAIFNFTYLGAAPGYIKGTAQNACGSFSYIFGFKPYNCGTTTDPCSINQAKIFTISPNPANGQIKIGVTNFQQPPKCPPLAKVYNSKEGFTFSAVNIYNKQGVLVTSYKTSSAKTATISTARLITGTYLVEIFMGDYIERQQLIIAK